MKDFLDQQRILDRGWAEDLGRGKEQKGNLEINLAFLEAIEAVRSGMAVLEVGCGIGTVVRHLGQRGCRVVGTDLSTAAIAYGKEKYPELDLRVAPAERLPFEDGSFDAVVSFDVFEHLPDVDAHVAEVRRVLKDDGWYGIGTPNRYCAAFFDTLKYRNFSWKSYHPSLHSPGQLRRRLQRHGFAARFVKMNTISDFSLQKLAGYGAALVRLVSRIDTRRLPLALQSNLYVVARRMEHG